MTKMVKTFCTLGILALALGACTKSEEVATPTPTGDDKAAAAAGDDKAAAAAGDDKAAAAAGDSIKIYATHVPPGEHDPVEIVLGKFAITQAEVDPANIEGATAEIEIDLSNIDSGIENRDKHLQSPDYLDVAQFGKATVQISEVKKGAGENVYTAQAEVAAHGVSKTFPVSFEVLQATDDGVRVQAEHTFSRLDFGIGKEPDGENEKVGRDLTIKMQLTLKNTK